MQCMAVWAKLEHTAPAPLSAAAALETGTLLLPALTTPTDCLDEDLATLRQVLLHAAHSCLASLHAWPHRQRAAGK